MNRKTFFRNFIGLIGIASSTRSLAGLGASQSFAGIMPAIADKEIIPYGTIKLGSIFSRFDIVMRDSDGKQFYHDGKFLIPIHDSTEKLKIILVEEEYNTSGMIPICVALPEQ